MAKWECMTSLKRTTTNELQPYRHECVPRELIPNSLRRYSNTFMNCFQTTFLAASPLTILFAVHPFLCLGYLFIGTVFKCFVKNNSCNPQNTALRRYYYYLSHKEVKKLVHRYRRQDPNPCSLVTESELLAPMPCCLLV